MCQINADGTAGGAPATAAEANYLWQARWGGEGAGEEEWGMGKQPIP